MDVLSIGNSFSQDAQRYIHNIAKCGGAELNTFNLYIGGCSLSKHYRNMLSEKPVYELEMNGEGTGFNVSLKEAVLNRDWDIITLQQVSSEATRYETYRPYLDKLVEYVRECAPKARVALHQVWAYEQDSERLTAAAGYNSHIDMFNDIKAACEKAAELPGIDFVIPSGELFQSIIAAGIGKIHRDTLHASYGIGRYAIGLLWYAFLTGNDIADNNFSGFDENIGENEIKIIKECVARVYEMYR